MPTYEYECTSCGHVFEVFHSISAKPQKSCPKCNQKVKRLISAGSGIIFKGSGFYATDYRKSSPPKHEHELPPQCPKAKDGCNACKARGNS